MNIHITQYCIFFLLSLLLLISPVQSYTHHNQYSFTHIIDSTIEKEYLIFLHEPPAIRAKQFGPEAMLENIQRVETEQEHLSTILEQKKISVKQSTRLVSNTLLVFGSLEEIQQLKQEGIIRDYIENLELELLLDESLPFLDIPLIWQGVDYGYTGQGVTIGVMDTGIDYTHPALGGCFGPGCKVFTGYDFVSDHDHPQDPHGHGTMVAAIIAGDDSEGLRGVAPDARLVSARVAQSGGANANLALAYDYFVDLNRNGIPFENQDDYVNIISISLAAGGNNAQNPLSLLADELMQQGVLVVVAAGNSGPNDYSVKTPGSSRESLTVGASVNNHGRQGSLELDGVVVEATVARHSGVGDVTGRLVDAGFGEDFSHVQPGEIVVVRLGEVSVNQQVIGAQSNGAAGLIIINDAPQEFQPRVYMNTPLILVGVSSALEHSLSTSALARLTAQYHSGLAQTIPSFSSRGLVHDANYTYILKPDVVAPGSSICTAYLGITDQHCYAGNYHMTSGTSLAAPHVSGLAALVMQAHPDWDPFMVRDAIKSSSVSINAPRNAQGFGLVNPVQLFDNNRSLLRDTRMFFGKSPDYSQQEFIILNPNSFSVTYQISMQGDQFIHPQEVTIPASSQQSIVVQLSEPPTSSYIGEVHISDSLQHNYLIPFVVDDRTRSAIRVIRPHLISGYDDERATINYLYILDAQTHEVLSQQILVFNEHNVGQIDYLYDEDESYIVVAVLRREPFTALENEQGIFENGEQQFHIGFATIDSSDTLINLSECQSFHIESFPDGYFSSLLSLTSHSPNLYGEFKTLVFSGHTSYYDKSFTNLPVEGLDGFVYRYVNNSRLTVCMQELPQVFHLDMLAVQHDDNEMYITKNRLEPFVDYTNPQSYQVDNIDFASSQAHNILYPYYQFKDKMSSVMSLHTYKELVPAIHTSQPLRIFSSMDSESFGGKTIDMFLWAQRPYYELIEEQSEIGSSSHYVVVHWEKPFFVLPGYTFINNNRELYTSDCVFTDQSPYELLNTRNKHYLRFTPHQVMFENTHFISNLFNITPGNLRFHSNFLSSSQHPSLQYGFTGTSVGMNTYDIEQFGTLYRSNYWCHNSFVDFSGDSMYIPADLNEPFTLRSQFPSNEVFASEAYLLDPYSMNVSFAMHTTMNALDANPPRLMAVNVTDEHVYLAVYDEELVTVNISVDGLLVEYDLIGDPFSQVPPQNYQVRPEHFFRVSIPQDEHWHRITLYAQDAVGNWQEQSFSVRKKSLEEHSYFDFADFLLLSTLYPSVLGDEYYNAFFDITADGVIDIEDLVLFGNMFHS